MITKEDKPNPITEFVVGVWRAVLGLMMTSSETLNRVITVIFTASLVLAVLGFIVPLGMEGAVVLYVLITDTISALYHLLFDPIINHVKALWFTVAHDPLPASDIIEAGKAVTTGDVPAG
jgi:hypothetical protein